MLRVTQILKIESNSIFCVLSNGVHRKIDIQSIITNHQHIKGVKQLENFDVLNTAKIGEMGEIYWKDLVQNSSGQWMDYDISAEYIYFNGELLEGI